MERVRRHDDVAPGEELLDAREEGGVDADDVLDRAVHGAGLLHHDAAVLLADDGLHLARLAVDELAEIHLAAEDLPAHLFDAGGAEAVGGAGPAEVG